jgi:hypothetical protein
MWAMIPMLRVLASGNSRMTGASAIGKGSTGAGLEVFPAKGIYQR